MQKFIDHPISPLIQPWRNSLSHPNGNQTDERAMVSHFSLRIALVTLPIPTSMTCMIACTFMSLVFQDIQALKSSEWAFVPVEFEIPYLYLQTRRFLWILDLTKRWARYHSPWYLLTERICQWRNTYEKRRHLSLQGEPIPIVVTPDRFFYIHPVRAWHSSLSRKFFASDGREYKWGYRVWPGQEWTVSEKINDFEEQWNWFVANVFFKFTLANSVRPWITF